MCNTKVRIPPDALEALREISALTGLSISGAACAAIMSYLEDVRRKEKEGATYEAAQL